MPPVPYVPSELRAGPFTFQMAAAHGVTERMLRGAQWKRIHPRVWVHRDHRMTHLDDLRAAVLTMPAHASLSHISRIQLLGIDVGEHRPIHLTVTGDLHIATDGVFLHRTRVMPPTDDQGVVPAAAFLQFCSTARLIEAVMVGERLLAEKHMTRSALARLAHRERWRPGASQAARVVPLLDGRSRSLKESELRMLISAAGLPAPQVNEPIFGDDGLIAIVDLLVEEYRFALEYEGRQHALDTHQFQRDIVRYRALREAGYDYLQVTQSMLSRPRALVMTVDSALRKRGYDGPVPRFGGEWTALFESIRPVEW